MAVLRANSETTFFPRLGLGLGLRSEHYSDVLSGRSSVSWFEAISENYMGAGGRPLHALEKVRANFPLALHGVSLSIGSTDPLDKDYLGRLKKLVTRFEPALVSDHLCWTGVDGENLHDLLPLPYTEDVIRHVVARVQAVQEHLGRRILLENVSSYLTYAHSEMEEWEFISEITKRADCGVLLDVNNIYVSAVNHGFDPQEFLNGVPAERVGQIHLAGHATRTLADGRVFLIDTHDHPVCDEVWALYGKAVARFGLVSTLVEWDANLPDFDALQAQARIAGVIQQRWLAGHASPPAGTNPPNPRSPHSDASANPNRKSSSNPSTASP